MGCDLPCQPILAAPWSFNPRTHMGCDKIWLAVDYNGVVSIHAPTWGATMVSTIGISLRLSFNPRTHMGCDKYKGMPVTRVLSFNPRTHMGCDLSFKITSCSYEVSIHAPTWGATMESKIRQQYNEVSIHAPTWGATLLILCITRKFMFQSTHPHGVRHVFYHISYRSPPVSIHAPTWGATYIWLVNQDVSTGFNPRTHMGCDYL